jgi:hypothetical protein
LLDDGMSVWAVVVEQSRPTLSTVDVEVAVRLAPSPGAMSCEDLTGILVSTGWRPACGTAPEIGEPDSIVFDMLVGVDPVDSWWFVLV